MFVIELFVLDNSAMNLNGNLLCNFPICIETPFWEKYVLLLSIAIVNVSPAE